MNPHAVARVVVDHVGGIRAVQAVIDDDRGVGRSTDGQDQGRGRGQMNREGQETKSAHRPEHVIPSPLPLPDPQSSHAFVSGLKSERSPRPVAALGGRIRAEALSRSGGSTGEGDRRPDPVARATPRLTPWPSASRLASVDPRNWLISLTSRRNHSPEVGGSNPPATTRSGAPGVRLGALGRRGARLVELSRLPSPYP